MPALAANSLIVVTGISGFVASHVALSALQMGHRVRGTVRSLSRADSVNAGFAKQGVYTSSACLEFVIIDDLTSQAQYEAAFQGADGVVHVAIPAMSTPDFVEVATQSVLSALRAAVKVPSIKRFVLTSTAVAVFSSPIVIDKVLTGDDWNVAGVDAYERATDEEKTHPVWPYRAYTAGKTLSEQAAWKFVKEQKPYFDLSSIIAFVNYGPVLHGDPQSSAACPILFLRNDTSVADIIPPQWYVDVRDCGLLHTLALTTPSAGGQRIWAAAEPYGWNDMLAILRKHFPGIQVPDDMPEWIASPQKLDSEYARQLLGGQWIPFEQSVIDNAKSVGY